MSIVDDILKPHSKRDGASETMETFGSITFLGNPETTERRFRKTCWLVGTFDDLRKIHNGEWEVRKGDGFVVRRLRYMKHKKNEVRIYSGDGSEIRIPSKTKIFYEPWDFDRGSYLFEAEGFEELLKLMTEFDDVQPSDWILHTKAIPRTEVKELREQYWDPESQSWLYRHE